MQSVVDKANDVDAALHCDLVCACQVVCELGSNPSRDQVTCMAVVASHRSHRSMPGDCMAVVVSHRSHRSMPLLMPDLMQAPLAI